MVNKKDISIIESLLFLQAIDQCAGKRKASETLNISIDTINKYIESLEDEYILKACFAASSNSVLYFSISW